MKKIEKKTERGPLSKKGKRKNGRRKHRRSALFNRFDWMTKPFHEEENDEDMASTRAWNADPISVLEV